MHIQLFANFGGSEVSGSIGPFSNEEQVKDWIDFLEGLVQRVGISVRTEIGSVALDPNYSWSTSPGTVMEGLQNIHLAS